MTEPADHLRLLIQAQHAVIWVTTPEERRIERQCARVGLDMGYLPRFWDQGLGATGVNGHVFTTTEKGQTTDDGAVEILPESKAGADTGMKRAGWVHESDRKRWIRPILPAPTNAPKTALMEILGGQRVHAGAGIPRSDGGKVSKAAECGRQEMWILRDFATCLQDKQGSHRRLLKSVAKELEVEMANHRRSVIVILSTSAEIPEELRSTVVHMDWPLPSREDIGSILDHTLQVNQCELTNGSRDTVVEAAKGLPSDAVASAFALSLAKSRKDRGKGRTIDPSDVRQYKKQVIDMTPGLSWWEPECGMEGVGGLGVLKGWLSERKAALSQEARDWGLPAPRGFLATGPTGTGKSLVAEATAAAWGLPLLSIDLGGLKSKWVGDSEGRLRAALKVAEALAPVVVLFDEIEKALAGSGSESSGVSSDQLGYLLTWMQRRKGTVFAVMTANDPTKLPPELTRKGGRIDEVWFVDLPHASERTEILRVSLLKAKPARDPEGFDLEQVSEATEGFTGAELSDLVPTALFRAYGDGKRQPTTEDLLIAAKATVPVSVTRAEEIDAMRQWAKKRARLASEAVPDTDEETEEESAQLGLDHGLGRRIT